MIKQTLGIFLLVPLLANGQKIAASFQEAINNHSLSIETLDERYQSALHSDSTKSVFKGREDEFTRAYHSLLQELSEYLKKNNFTWGKEVRSFNRIYINRNGEIDYFLFNFREGEIEELKEQHFKKLLTKFVENYTFPLASEVNFAQCSPVKYRD